MVFVEDVHLGVSLQKPLDDGDVAVNGGDVQARSSHSIRSIGIDSPIQQMHHRLLGSLPGGQQKDALELGESQGLNQTFQEVHVVVLQGILDTRSVVDGLTQKQSTQ